MVAHLLVRREMTSSLMRSDLLDPGERCDRKAAGHGSLDASLTGLAASRRAVARRTM